MADDFIQAPSTFDIKGLVSGKFGSKVIFRESTKKNIKAINENRRLFMTTDRDTIYDLCKYFHDVLNFEQCTAVCAVDYIDYVQIVYFLTNYFNGVMVEITVDIPNDDLHIPSVALIWEGANWHERETYELFGVIFDGHPKLKRLLTPDEYEFYPFRKSYKLRGAQ